MSAGLLQIYNPEGLNVAALRDMFELVRYARLELSECGSQRGWRGSAARAIILSRDGN
jgi:hypothetical protein